MKRNINHLLKRELESLSELEMKEITGKRTEAIEQLQQGKTVDEITGEKYKMGMTR